MTFPLVTGTPGIEGSSLSNHRYFACQQAMVMHSYTAKKRRPLLSELHSIILQCIIVLTLAKQNEHSHNNIIVTELQQDAQVRK